MRVDGSVTLDVPGPKVVFCREGAVRLANGRSCTVEAGRSVFIGAGTGPVTASGAGTLFLAAPGEPV